MRWPTKMIAGFVRIGVGVVWDVAFIEIEEYHHDAIYGKNGLGCLPIGAIARC